MESDAVKIVVSFLGGGVAGAVITYILTERRDKRNRRRTFRAYLVETKSFVDATQVIHGVSNDWSVKKHALLANADKVRDAIPWWKRRAFDKAVARLGAISAGDVGERSTDEKGNTELIGHKKLSDALREVIKFLR